MKYQSAFAYRLPEIDDKGYSDMDKYLLVNSVGYYEFDDNYEATYRKYGRKDYYLSYNLEGKMKVKASGEELIVEPGDIFIYKPLEEQFYGQSSIDRISNYWVHFTGYGAAEILFKANLGNGNIFHIGVNEEIPAQFDKLLNEVDAKKFNYEYMSSAILQSIIFEMSRRLQYTKSGQYKNESEERISKTLSYIHKNYSKNITVAELSNIAGITVNYYSSTFSEITGVSPRQYIINYRLLKAKELMCYTNLNIRQIASLVGFEDQLYFSRLFKKYENISPGDYKKNLASGTECK